jgi:anti-sigma-K factor RskA
MMQGEHISQEDLALQALRALSQDESAAVCSHVEQCAECRDELAALMGDLALVALTAEPLPLPAGARDRFVKRIAEDAAAAPVQRPVSGAQRVISIDRKPASKAVFWIPSALAAALLIVAFWLGVRVNQLDDQLRAANEQAAQLAAANARARAIEEVLTAKAAQRIVLSAAKTPPTPAGRAIYLAASGGLIFQANNLASIPEGKTYELWVIPASGAPIPSGLFRPDAQGNASVVLPQLPTGVPAKAIGVTLEKAEGSATPTAPVLLLGAVASGE